MAGNGRDDSFYAEVLRGIGAPVNDLNLSVLRAWQRAEGGTSSWNPFNTTMPAKGATRYGSNSAGVKNYTSREQGIDATVRTIKQGYYRNVVAALKQSNPTGAIAAIIASPWAGGHYGAKKTQSGTYNYASTTFYKVWHSMGGSPAATSGTLPTGLASGTGAKGVAKYDPLTNALIAPDGKIYFPWTLWLKNTDAATRKATRITIVPGAYKAAGAGLDAGAVTEVNPANIVADVASAAIDPLASISGFFSLLTSNWSRVALVLLGVFVIIAGIMWANRAAITQNVGTAAKLAAVA